MGLFSTKKKIYVSSVLYNLAGDINDRPDFLSSSIATTVVTQDKVDLAGSIHQNYMNGPGMSLRSFFRWATSDDKYAPIGVPTQQLSHEIDLDISALAQQIPYDHAHQISVQKAEAGIADFIYWSNQWMMANHPELMNTNWTSDIDQSNNITIHFVDGSSVTFTPNDFDPQSLYIYAVYQTSLGQASDPVQTGQTITLRATDPWPDVTGWASGPSSLVQHSVNLRHTNPDGSSTTSPASYVSTNYQYNTKTSSTGSGDSISFVNKYMYWSSDYTVQTDSFTDGSKQEKLVPVRAYRIDTQNVQVQSWTATQVFIYRVGAGNTVLDNMVNSQGGDQKQFFPYIPLRIDNKYITEYGDDTVNALVKKACKKVSSGPNPLQKLIDTIDDNPSVGDIDYAYVSFGVVLNTKEVTGRHYLYDFFTMLYNSTSNNGNVSVWRGLLNEYNEAQAALEKWKANPVGAQPVVPAYPTMPQNSIRIVSDGTSSIKLNYDMEITWNSITKISGQGLYDANQKSEYYIEQKKSINSSVDILISRISIQDTTSVDRTVIIHQIDDLHWEGYEIAGLNHRNMIYGGKFVDTSASDALADTEESSFLVPLHYPTFVGIGLKNYTQLSTACSYLVFNCYLVKKVHWYQRGIFKIIIAVVIIVVTAVLFVPSGGTSSIVGAGLLGTAAGVGAALGFSGIIAVVVGALANAIVAAIVMKIISVASVAVFGDKLGAIIGAIASFAAIAIGTNLMNGGSLATSFSNLTSASGLISASSAVGQGISGYMAGEIKDIQAKGQALTDQYKDQLQQLTDTYTNMFGSDNTQINTMALVEPRDTFLNRTLMTGSDIAEMTNNLLSNFADLTLSTDLAI